MIHMRVLRPTSNVVNNFDNKQKQERHKATVNQQDITFNSKTEYSLDSTNSNTQRYVYCNG